MKKYIYKKTMEPGIITKQDGKQIFFSDYGTYVYENDKTQFIQLPSTYFQIGHTKYTIIEDLQVAMVVSCVIVGTSRHMRWYKILIPGYAYAQRVPKSKIYDSFYEAYAILMSRTPTSKK